MNPTDAKELKPCPFCGESEDENILFDSRGSGEMLCYFVLCNQCGSEGPWATTKEQALTDWNTRAPSALSVGLPKLELFLQKNGYAVLIDEETGDDLTEKQMREVIRRCTQTSARESELAGALQYIIDDQVDYMTRNNLGDPEKQSYIMRGRAVLDAHRASATNGGG